MVDKNISVIVIIAMFFLTACMNSKDDYDYNSNVQPIYTVDYIEEDIENVLTYIINGERYKNLVTVYGRSNNARCDSYYKVLTNDEDITFEKADKRFFGSYLPLIEDFRIVEYGLIVAAGSEH